MKSENVLTHKPTLDSSDDNIAMTNQSEPNISEENSHPSTLIILVIFDSTGVNIIATYLFKGYLPTVIWDAIAPSRNNIF